MGNDPLARSLTLWTKVKVVLFVLLILSGIFRLWQLAIVLVLLGVAGFVWQRGRSSDGTSPPV
jgi:hypothetical protein